MNGGNYEKNKGFQVEEFVNKKFAKSGFYTEFTSQRSENKYFDLKIWDSNFSKVIKLEIKSCNFIINNGNGRQDFGRFDFTNERSITRQRTNNIYICFVVCIGNSFEILGFLTSKSLKKKFISKRYIPLKTIMNSRLTKFSKFIEKLKDEK